MKKQIILLALLLSTACISASAQNSGIGTLQPGSKLTVNGSFAATYNKVSGPNYTMTADDYFLAWNGTADGTVTLPAYTAYAAPATSIKGRTYHIKNTGSGILTVKGDGSEVIDNQANGSGNSFILQPGCFGMVISTGLQSATGTTWELAYISCTGVISSLDVFNGTPGSSFTSGEICYDKICIRSVSCGFSQGMDLQVKSNTGTPIANVTVGGYQVATSGVNSACTWTGTLSTSYATAGYVTTSGCGYYDNGTAGFTFHFGAAFTGEYIFYYITLADGTLYRITQTGIANGTQIQLVLEKMK